MSARKGAEILATEVSIDGKKFVFCTVYRFGNLDKPKGIGHYGKGSYCTGNYGSGSLPKEWKLANVVSIHKKRGKDVIKNDMPIS